MKRLLIILFSSISMIGMSQNRVMLLQPGDSIGSVKYNPHYEETGLDRIQYDIPKAPAALVTAVPFDVKFRDLANQAVNDFQVQHLEYGYINEQYSLWLDGHMRVVGWSTDYTSAEEYTAQTERLKQTLLGSKVLQEVLYNWLMPAYKDAFALMSVPEQNDYLALFQGAKEYIQTLDLNKEKDAAELEDFLETRGKLNAFFFRRISKDEMTKEECIQWLDRIISDFESVKKQNPSPADDYVLRQEVSPDYFLACIYSEHSYYGGPEIVMRKSREQYSILPGVAFTSSTVLGNMIIGSIDEKPNGDFRGIFMFDSLGWSFTTCKYSGYPDGYLMRGDDANKRIMFTEGWAEIPDPKTGSETVAQCTFVDADSGTVISDSVYIRAEIYETEYYTQDYSFTGLGGRYIIYYSFSTGMFGLLDNYGNSVLDPKYKSIETTDKENVFKVNGRKKIKVK